jgi:hypothetical protein
VSCPHPLAPETLVDYWLDDAPDADVEAVEEHLFGCESCSGRLRGLVALGEGIRRLARDGGVQMVVTPFFLDKAAREGLHAREYRVAPGGRVSCTVTPSDDLLVARLLGDFKGLSRLDLVAEEEGRPTVRVEDVPFDPQGSELIVAQAMPHMRALPRSITRLRLVSPAPGGERVVGEYTFDHTPSPR